MSTREVLYPHPSVLQDATGSYQPSKSGVALDEESFYQLQNALEGLRFDGTYGPGPAKVAQVLRKPRPARVAR